MMFNRYISLGENCETSFQIKRILGKATSGFFAWDIPSVEAFRAVLENDSQLVMLKKNLESHVAAHEGKTALFYKSYVEHSLRDDARQIYDLLVRFFPERNFSLIVLQDKKFAEPSWELDGVYNRYLDRLAPEHDQRDGHLPSWDEVFKEFPLHGVEMRYAGYGEIPPCFGYEEAMT